MKRKWIILAVDAVLLAVLLFLMTGFQTRSDVSLGTFSLSENCSTITLQAGPAGSMGYIRAIDTEQSGDRLYCKFYCAFGGLNSSLGAKNTFVVDLPPDCTEIWFYRGDGSYALVLEKDNTTGLWQRVT